jgi:hypothetical protein
MLLSFSWLRSVSATAVKSPWSTNGCNQRPEVWACGAHTGTPVHLRQVLAAQASPSTALRAVHVGSQRRRLAPAARRTPPPRPAQRPDISVSRENAATPAGAWAAAEQCNAVQGHSALAVPACLACVLRCQRERKIAISPLRNHGMRHAAQCVDERCVIWESCSCSGLRFTRVVVNGESRMLRSAVFSSSGQVPPRRGTCHPQRPPSRHRSPRRMRCSPHISPLAPARVRALPEALRRLPVRTSPTALVHSASGSRLGFARRPSALSLCVR